VESASTPPAPGWDPDPPRERLLAGVRAELPRLAGGLRMLAADVLGEDARIDFVTVARDGRVVLVLVGWTGDDLEIVAQGLAQRSWVEARLADWLQLAPQLPLRADVPVGLLLLCPAFRPAARRAAASLGSDVALGTWRCQRTGGGGAGGAVWVEEIAPGEAGPGRRSTAEPAVSPPAVFRSGLTEEELGLTPEERRDLA
jgi:hypothetical protein